MIPYIISNLGFILAVMLQYGIFSRTNLLAGSIDIVLLFVAAWSLHQRSKYLWVVVLIYGSVIGFISAMPALIPISVYLLTYFAANALRVRMWQTPLLAMFLLTFAGTLFQHIAYIAWLFISGVSFSFSDAFTRITLPSVLLNMLLAIPVHALMQEISRSVYPPGLEV